MNTLNIKTWDTWPNAKSMLDYLLASNVASERKLRLFCVECAWVAKVLLPGQDLYDVKICKNRTREDFEENGFDEITPEEWSKNWCRYATTRNHPNQLVTCSILREVFYNPFDERLFESLVLTSDVVSMARSIYDTRDYASMPVLGDALEEAGNSPYILNHARGDFSKGKITSHTRGCWLLDSILSYS